MTVEDRLRRSLRAYERTVDVSADALSRIHGLTAPPRRRGHAWQLVFAGFATAIAIALVVTLVTIVRDDGGDSEVAAGPGSVEPPPEQIAAVTADGRLVVLSSADGRELRTLDERAAVASHHDVEVSADGETIYFVRDTGATCQDAPITEIARVPIGGGAVETLVANVRFPALSPDGRFLAFTGIPGCSDAGRRILVMDLETGEGKDFSAATGSGIGRLAWAPDSRHLAFVLFDSPQGSYPRVVDTTTATSLDEVPIIPIPDGSWVHGYLGATGKLLGTRAAGTTEPQLLALVTFDSASGVIDRTLFRLREERYGEQTVVSDATGRHVLAVGVDPPALYRWSEEQDEPTKVSDGIVAAAWVPGRSDGPEPAPTTTSSIPTTVGPPLVGAQGPCGVEVPFRPTVLPEGFLPDPVSGGASSMVNPDSPAVLHYTDGGGRFIEIHHPGTLFVEIVGEDGEFPNVDVLGRGGTLVPLSPSLEEPLIVEFALTGYATDDPCASWSLDGYGVTEVELRTFAEGLVPTR